MRPFASQVGGADEWIVRVTGGRREGAGAGGDLLQHFYTSSGGHKSGKVAVIHHRHTSSGLAHPSNNDEWWEGGEGCKGRSLSRILIPHHFLA